ncbi:Fungal-trans domain-containing protein [Fusarium keratoplasticum]|uniref:Fungal-trans domain-containing protein n=1 Tax=Fusarium keratoplasticum TaxID=1328300 RepID=A0ACC0QKA4_9HYPO|nr:Fungal-trans domain-containing protein [Fusarium keratoplasticum]KAI8657742.1 Fungal-trans domain-containing protein [Fusarium keratoplasticum]KAI8658706.1 Fungal-trans domain-containing protein [Fusarium keratoplasticum]
MADDLRSQLGVDADGPDEGSDEPQATSSTTIRRACDACRTRKIRCDRNSPCSHCIHAKIPCTHQDSRPKEKRTRILLSAQYERKIDLIDRRLEAVTQLLRDMKMNMPSIPPTSQKDTPSPDTAGGQPSAQPVSTPFSHAAQPAADSPVVEGESSLAAHGAFANEFLKNAVNTGALQGASLELRETLDSLHHIVTSLKQQTVSTEMNYPNATIFPRPSLKGSEMPPIQKAVALIRQCENEPSEVSAWIHAFLPLERFSSVCMNVYFVEDFSESDFILTNAGLLYLFFERAQRSTDKDEREDLERYIPILQGNLETALANLPFHLPLTSSMISALLLGAFHAIEISKPSLSWTLICKASELCQTLGYHRASTMKNDDPREAERKQFLFWNVYFIDKSLSLRLGRASTIQDWDITVPIPDAEKVDDSPLSAFAALWVTTARCQGQIYEMLYSPDSINQPEDVRRYRVQTLVNTMRGISKKSAILSAKHLQEAKKKMGSYFMDFVIVSDDVLRLSLLTLIYRASPLPANSRSTFIPECVEAARATLQRHQDCMDLLGKDNSFYFPSYVHWTLLFAPFIPFIVVFCQVIETQDQADLARLHSFCTSTESSVTLSEAAAKTHRLFQVLYTVALRYIEFRTCTPPADQTQAQASAELNTYLTALGFPPAHIDNRQQQQPTSLGPAQAGAFSQPLGDPGMLDGTEGQRGANTMMWMGNTAQLEEWFNSNQQMMELLEEPSFTFPPQ